MFLDSALFSNLYLAALFFFLTFFINFFFKKKSILLDKVEKSEHKNFVNQKNIPLSLGLVFIIFFFFTNSSYDLKIYLILLFILGIFSDLYYFKKPSIKLLFQILIISFFIYENLFLISSLKGNIVFNYISSSLFLKICFTIFCASILINGSNFCDGINTLAIGNFFLVNLFLIFVSSKYNLEIKFLNLDKTILILAILFYYNFFGKAYLGDSGSYMLGGYFAYVAVSFFENNSYISPFFIIVLLWYPCFEVLFSIIRKKIHKKNIASPDNYHLHHFILIKINFFFKASEKSSFLKGSFSALFIHIYNFVSYYVASINIYNSTALVFLLFINISIYLFIYNFLSKKYEY